MKSDTTMPVPIKADHLDVLVARGAIPVDIRQGKDWVSGHIPGSIFLGEVGAFHQWNSRLISGNADLILISQTGISEEFKGYVPLIEHKKGKIYFLEGGMKAWQQSNGAMDMIITIDAEELALDLKFDKNLLLLDLREPDIYADEHIQGAVNLPLADMKDIAQIAGVDEDVNLYLYDESPVNSLIASSIFKRHGYQHLRVIHQKWSEIVKYKEMPLATQRRQDGNP